MCDAANFHLWRPGEFLLFLAPDAHDEPLAVLHAPAAVRSYAQQIERHLVFFLQVTEVMLITMVAVRLLLRQVRFAGTFCVPLLCMPALMPGKSYVLTESGLPALTGWRQLPGHSKPAK